MLDYITSKPLYTFLGGNNIANTAAMLLERCKADGIEAALRLVPEGNFNGGASGVDGLQITEETPAASTIYMTLPPSPSLKAEGTATRGMRCTGSSAPIHSIL